MNDTLITNICSLFYLLSAAMFVRGLHRMNAPRTARSGNQLSAIGMVIAVATAIVEMFLKGIASPVAIIIMFVALIIGGVIGAVSGRKVQMTQMPQLVSVFNMVGGGAAAIVALNDSLTSTHISTFVAIVTVLGVAIGSLTFAGSLIAAGKLQGIVSGSPVHIVGGVFLDVIALACVVVGGVWYAINPTSALPVFLVMIGALGFGLLLVFPIGGADMPVVVSVLNAGTGLAVAMSGFVIGNTILIVAGALVGSAGTMLSFLMAKAMNRSLGAIMAGGFGGAPADSGAGAGDSEHGPVKSTDADDAAIQLAYANKVIMVPGYGLAAARAQQEMADLGKLLQSKGIDVSYAIHPVAGRMPGHMNVLLAEANVPYEQLKDMDDINPQFAQADVALVVGANDVTNPLARQPGSPIAGMPILNVDQAKSVIVVKRSMNPGYAGIDNLLYYEPQTSMYFGDAKKALGDLITAIKALDA